MAIFRYLFDNEWGQRYDIENLKQRANNLEMIGVEVSELQVHAA